MVVGKYLHDTFKLAFIHLRCFHVPMLNANESQYVITRLGLKSLVVETFCISIVVACDLFYVKLGCGFIVIMRL